MFYLQVAFDAYDLNYDGLCVKGTVTQRQQKFPHQIPWSYLAQLFGILDPQRSVTLSLMSLM